jgi:hypothetical protein
MDLVVSYFGMMGAAFAVGSIGGAIVAEREVSYLESKD